MRINRKKNQPKSTSKCDFLQLNKNLMSKLSQSENSKLTINKQTFHLSQPKTSKIKSQFIQDFEFIDLNNKNPYSNVLQKAKVITTLNKNQLQKVKKNIKKSQQQQKNGAFLTGCGLYTQQKQQFQQFTQNTEQIDLNQALKYLVKNEKDDLAELRKLIRKTSTNLNEYSNNRCNNLVNKIHKTQNQVQQAAQLFGRQLNLDLKMKITKCGFYKQPDTQKISKRKISSSNGNKR